MRSSSESALNLLVILSIGKLNHFDARNTARRGECTEIDVKEACGLWRTLRSTHISPCLPHYSDSHIHTFRVVTPSFMIYLRMLLQLQAFSALVKNPVYNGLTMQGKEWQLTAAGDLVHSPEAFQTASVDLAAVHSRLQTVSWS